MKKIKDFLKSKFCAALLAGGFCSLAFAPFHFFIAAPISLSVFYFLLEEKDKKKDIFWLGFSYGFGYFLSGIYWIAISLLVDAASFGWLIPFALTLIPSTLAAYVALFALSYKFIIRKFSLNQTYQKIILFSVCWLFFEILRSLLFTGFPWNLLGYIWMFDVSFAQAAKVFGIYGLSVFAVLISLSPTLFFRNKKTAGDKIFATILVCLFIVNFIFGYIYINKTELIEDDKVKLRLVQGNVAQAMKWNPEEKYRNFTKHIELTNSKSLEDIAAVIWSETSVPYAIDDNSELMEKLQMVVPPRGVLITGGLRLGFFDKEKTRLSDAWNSVFTIDKSGIIAAYDKHHLVPFGEYIPWQKYLPFIEKITDGAVGFSEGEGPQTLQAHGFSFSPLICYEVIFSDEVLNKKSRPDLFVNVTNDAWFGNSSGPYQHLDIARMRTIEYGIPMARVANTGITAFIDPFGKIVERINLNQAGIIDVNLIKNLAPTIYEKYSYLPLTLLLLVMLMFLITPKGQKKNVTRKNHTS